MSLILENLWELTLQTTADKFFLLYQVQQIFQCSWYCNRLIFSVDGWILSSVVITGRVTSPGTDKQGVALSMPATLYVADICIVQGHNHFKRRV